MSEKVRMVVAVIAILALLWAPWLTLSSAAGSINYSMFRVKVASDSASLSASYPEMQQRYLEEDMKSIDVALAAKLAPYMRVFQLWAIATAALFFFVAFMEKHKKVYFAAAASILSLSTAYFIAVYRVTREMSIANSPADLVFGRAFTVKFAFTKIYLTLELHIGWYLAIVAGVFMLIYAAQYKYWRLKGMF